MVKTMHLLFRPAAGGAKKCYRVSVKTYSENSKQKRSTLTYDYVISLKKESWDGYIVNFHRKNVLLNNAKIQEPIHEILLLSGQVLHDLDLEITSEGKILHIKNWGEVKKKWEEIKFKIETTYKGEVVAKIIAPMDQTLQNEKTTITALGKDPFFYNYLKGVYGEYQNGKIAFEGTLPGFLPKYDLSVTKQNKISETEMKEYSIISTSEVIQNDMDTLKENWKKEEKEGDIEFNISSRYTLSQEKTIKNISTSNILFYNNTIVKSVEISIQQQTVQSYE